MTEASPRERARSRWWAMIDRCTNPENPRWKDYGGRGITVCPEWMDFPTYYRDTGDKPFEGATIDRVDNDGPYSPGNWRWATWAQQSSNKRKFLPATCPWGHPYDEENTYYARSQRVCRACRRVIKRRALMKRHAR